MAEFRDGHDTGSRDAEVFLVDADGSSAPVSISRRSPLGTGARLGILLGVMALFAAGVVVGRSTLNLRSGSAMRVDTAVVAPTSASGSSDRSSGITPSPSSQVEPDVESSASDPASNSGTVPERFPQAVDLCGGLSYVAQVGYVLPLPGPIDMTVTAGNPPRVYDLSDETVSPPLVQLADDEFVSAIAADDHGTVMMVRSCAAWFARIVRLAADGSVTSIDMPADVSDQWQPFAGLIDIDGEIWAELRQRGGGWPLKVLATDGSGRIEVMPDDPDWVGGGRNHAVSPDGSYSAANVLDPAGPRGYQVQITVTATGDTAIVPGLRLGGASASLMFSPDSQWLVVVVNTLAGGRMLVYAVADAQGPYAFPGTLGSAPRPWGIRIYSSDE